MPDIEMAPYVLAAYVLGWAVLVGYCVYLAAKMSKIGKEVDHLKELLKKE